MGKSNETIKPDRSLQMEQIYDRIYRSDRINKIKHENKKFVWFLISVILLFAICTLLSIFVSYRFVYVFLLGVNCLFLTIRLIEEKKRKMRTTKYKNLESVENGHRPYKK